MHQSYPLVERKENLPANVLPHSTLSNSILPVSFDFMDDNEASSSPSTTMPKTPTRSVSNNNDSDKGSDDGDNDEINNDDSGGNDNDQLSGEDSDDIASAPVLTNEDHDSDDSMEQEDLLQDLDEQVENSNENQNHIQKHLEYIKSGGRLHDGTSNIRIRAICAIQPDRKNGLPWFGRVVSYSKQNMRVKWLWK